MANFQIYNIYFIAGIAVIGGSLFGFDISSMSAFLNTQAYLTYFNAPNSTLQGFITGAMALGSLFASLASGTVSDRIGRKRTIQLAALIWIIGSIIQASAPNVAALIVGRLISGVAVGLNSSQIPVYLAELAPKDIRGRIVGLQQWAITWGIMIQFYISFGCTYLGDQRSFKLAWGLMAIPGLVLFLALFCLPESPRWLAAKGRVDEVRSILANVHGKGNHEDPMVVAEFNEIEEACKLEEKSKRLGFRALFQRRMLKRTFVGAGLQVWQQLTGMNVMMYYISYVFAMAGLVDTENLVSSSIQYVINVVMTTPALLFIDRWGRRPLLMAGAILMCLWLSLVGGLMAQYGSYQSSVAGNANIRWEVTGPPAKAIIAFTYLFVATFACSWGVGIWVYVSEIFPIEVRAQGNGFAAACNWAMNFALAWFVPVSFTNIQWQTYIIFAVFCFVMAFFVFFLAPETCGKSLEEINLIWEEDIPPWKTRARPSALEADAKAIAAEGGFNLEKGQKAEHVEKV